MCCFHIGSKFVSGLVVKWRFGLISNIRNSHGNLKGIASGYIFFFFSHLDSKFDIESISNENFLFQCQVSRSGSYDASRIGVTALRTETRPFVFKSAIRFIQVENIFCFGRVGSCCRLVWLVVMTIAISIKKSVNFFSCILNILKRIALSCLNSL